MQNLQNYYQQPGQFQQGQPTGYPTYPQYSTVTSDPIDQISKVASLLDHLRNPSTRPQVHPSQPIQHEPQSTPTVGSTAQFQSANQQDLNRQYQEMASIQSGNSSTNKLSPEQLQAVQNLQNAVTALDKELHQAYSAMAEMYKFVEVNKLLNQEIDALDSMLKQTTPFIQTSQVWMQDALQHETVLENVCSLLTSPEFLLYWTFESLKNLNLIESDFDAIADTYLSFLQSKGKYNPQQQQQSVPFPPSPGQNVPQVNAKLQAVELMRSGNPEAARMLQRARMQGVY